MRAILILKLNAIGDVVFATPLVEALRQVYPEAALDWLVGRHAEPVLRGHPSLRDRIVYDGPWGAGRAAAVAETARLLPRLRRTRYDAVFCLHRSPLAMLIAALSGARCRIGFDHRLAPRLLTHTAAFDSQRHESERYLGLLRALGHPVANPGLRLGWTPEADAAVDALLAGRDLPRPWLALAPGGGRNPGAEMLFKRWPADRYAEVAATLVAQTGGSVLVLGTPDEADLCAEVAAATPAAIDLCGRTRLTDLPALLARCDVLVANDSGPLHIAAAVGTPTVALFGPTDPRLVAPLGPRHRHLWQPPECGPCYRPDNSRSRTVWTCGRAGDELRCLRDIGVEQVTEAVRAALVRPHPAVQPEHP